MCTIPDHETGGHLQLILTYCWPSTSWQHACSRVFEPRKKLSSVNRKADLWYRYDLPEDSQTQNHQRSLLLLARPLCARAQGRFGLALLAHQKVEDSTVTGPRVHTSSCCWSCLLNVARQSRAPKMLLVCHCTQVLNCQ